MVWGRTASPGDPLLRDAARQLKEYFAGRRRRFDVALAPQGTAFQQSVWRAIAKVPAGRTASYGDLARRIGRSAAVRAVTARLDAMP